MFKEKYFEERHANGNLLRTGFKSWFSKRPLGEWKVYDENGEGILKHCIIYSSGTKLIEAWYHDNGNLTERWKYIEGVLNSKGWNLLESVECYHENGALHYKRNYVRDLNLPDFTQYRDGPDVMLYPDGQIKQSGEFRNGEMYGPLKGFYESGNLKFEFFRDENGRQGEQRTYHENGNLQYLQNFKNGELHGEYKTFDEDGQLVALENYVNGKEV